MPRVALLFFALFASFFVTLATPIPVPNSDGTVVDLQKRVTHSGGRGTWFDVGLGNCGHTDSASQPVVAIPLSLYNRNGGSNCDQWVSITDTKNGKKAYGWVRDSCPGCGPNDLDMSTSLFQKFEGLDVGVLSISWNFMAKGWKP